MSPYFNTLDGSMNPESDDLTTEPYLTEPVTPPPPPSRIGLGPAPPAPEKPKDAAGSAAPPLKPGWPALDTLEQIEAFRAGIPGDPYHPAHGDFELMDYVARREWELSGKPVNAAGQPIDPETGEPGEREVFANGQLRAKDADALSPAMRPALPEGSGMQWDEAALQAAETEAHACGLPSHTVMTVTAELTTAVEQAEARGVEWSAELGGAELVRRHGREGAQELADRARIAYQTIVELETEAPRLVHRVRELGRDWGDDPNVTETFAAILTEIQNAAPSARLEALLLRRTERAMRAEAKANAEAEQIRREQDAEGDEAAAARMAGVALAHRRWGRTEP
jgi:hypothetical protein